MRDRIESELGQQPDVDIIVMEPGSATNGKRKNPSADAPKMTPGSAILIAMINRYLRGGIDPFVTRLEAFKLMYLMQEAGGTAEAQVCKRPVRAVRNKPPALDLKDEQSLSY